MNNLRILVTGGAGFIGSNIVEYLLNNNVKFVRVLDNFATGKKENIDLFVNHKNFEFMFGDITDLETCKKAMVNIDVVCQQAALGSVPRSIDNPLATHNTNVNGFFNILLAAKDAGIKRVVYASSSSVFGDSKELPKKEERIGRELSPYAVTKHVDELYGYIFTKTYGMECIGLRYFNVFGPRQDPNGAYAAVIPKFINKMMNNETPTVNGDGTYSRDFTYVINVVQANILALTVKNPVCFGEIFNIGTSSNFSINDMLHVLNKQLNKQIVPIYGPVRNGDVPHSHADISKAKKFLKYDPQINFEEGIKKTVEYMLNTNIKKQVIKINDKKDILLIYYDPGFTLSNGYYKTVLESIQTVSRFYNTFICVVCDKDLLDVKYNRVVYIKYQNNLIDTFRSSIDFIKDTYLKIRMYCYKCTDIQDTVNFCEYMTTCTDFKLYFNIQESNVSKISDNNNKSLQLVSDFEKSKWRLYNNVVCCPPPILNTTMFYDKQISPLKIGMIIWDDKSYGRVEDAIIMKLASDNDFVIKVNNFKDQTNINYQNVKILYQLNKEEYQKMLREINIIILPYDTEYYKNKMSGVFIDALSHKCVILYKSGVQFGDFVDKNRIGVGYNSSTDLLEKLELIKSNYRYFYENYNKNGEAIKKYLKPWEVTSFYNIILN